MLYAKIALAVLGVCVVLIIAGRYLEHALMYHPDTRRVPPGDAGLADVEELVIGTPDGHEVIAWWGRARPGQPTILYFHGNGGSLAGRAEEMARYLARGQGMMIMTYRGYGGSTGSPSERANVADAKLAFDTLVARGVVAGDIILYGESLGSGVAAQVAADRPAGGLILDAPYTSIVDVGAGAYPFLPARLLMRDRYETMNHIGRVRCPLLIIHGDRDDVIPVAMGRAVHAAAPEPKAIVIIPGAGHSDHQMFGSFEAVQDWIGKLRDGKLVRAPS